MSLFLITSFGLIIRHSLLALSLVTSIFPAVAFGAPAGAPCDLVDREALIALELGYSEIKTEHKEISGAKDLSNQGVDTCTITPRDLPLPSLTVTTAKFPADAKTVRPSCDWQSIHGMEIAICSATVKNTFVTFTMVTKGSSNSTMKTTLSSQVNRLVNRLAGSGSKGIPRQ